MGGAAFISVVEFFSPGLARGKLPRAMAKRGMAPLLG